MKLRPFFIVLSIVTSSLAAAAPATTTQRAPASQNSQRWEKNIRAYEEADKQNPPPEGAILFIGSSSTLRWKTLAKDFPEFQVINRGFGGSEIADVTYYADRVIIPYKPRLILLQAGSNDIAMRRTPEQVAANFKAFVEKVRAALPAARIAYCSINPAPSRWSQRDNQQKANQLIKNYIATQQNMDYIDLWSCFLGPDGAPREDLFVADRLHNNAEGYKIRAAVVKPHLK